MKKKPILYSLVLIGVLTTLAVFLFLRKERSSELISPKRGPIVEAVYGIGTVTARNHFSFRLGVATTAVKTFVHEGSSVKKGQALIQISPELTIRTPFDGTVTVFTPNEGENIFPDQTIVTVENLKDRYILATIDQQSALRVKKEMPVALHFETIQGQIFTGRVETIYPSKGQFMVWIEAAHLPESVLPGMTADASIQVAERQNVLLVPVLSIQQGKLLLERNGKREKVDVKIGVTDSEWAEIVEGDVRETDLVVKKK